MCSGYSTLWTGHYFLFCFLRNNLFITEFIEISFDLFSFSFRVHDGRYELLGIDFYLCCGNWVKIEKKELNKFQFECWNIDILGIGAIRTLSRNDSWNGIFSRKEKKRTRASCWCSIKWVLFSIFAAKVCSRLNGCVSVWPILYSVRRITLDSFGSSEWKREWEMRAKRMAGKINDLCSSELEPVYTRT